MRNNSLAVMLSAIQCTVNNLFPIARSLHMVDSALCSYNKFCMQYFFYIYILFANANKLPFPSICFKNSLQTNKLSKFTEFVES